MAGGSPFITDAIWWLWTWCSGNIIGARLGGIYANKSGYHNTVDANQSGWPGDYSIQLAQDRLKPHDKARAFDLTLAYAQMVLLTGYLRRAAEHPDDNRLDSLREFYGTLDGVNVFGLIHDGAGQAWSSSTSDSSHLWHIHMSFFTDQVNNQAAMEAIASVLAGVTWEQWTGQGNGGSLSPSNEEDGLNGIICQDGNSIVRAWIDPILGPVYDNVIDGNYIPMWVAMGFKVPEGGGVFMIPTIAHLGKDFASAQAEYYDALRAGGSGGSGGGSGGGPLEGHEHDFSFTTDDNGALTGTVGGVK